MKLRQAIKICRDVYSPDLDRRAFRKKHTWGRIERARRVCSRGRRWLNDKRIPYIPSEEELHEQAEIFGCLMFEVAKEMGAPEDEVEAKRTEFLIAMSKE